MMYELQKEGIILVKAYINNGTITVSSGKKSCEYPVGSGAVSLGNKWDFDNPYVFFADFDEESLAKFAKAELDKIYALDVFTLDSLAKLDASRKNKLYLSNNYTVTLEYADKAIPCFILSEAKELFCLEIIIASLIGKPLKICENCGKYFFPTGRTDSVYCDRITENGYSCKKIGAHRQYRRNSRANDLKKLYDKVTKHNRYLKSKGALSAYEYGIWMSEASEKYADFKADKLSSVEFEAWLLGKEIAPAPKTRSRSSISDYLL